MATQTRGRRRAARTDRFLPEPDADLFRVPYAAESKDGDVLDNDDIL